MSGLEQEYKGKVRGENLDATTAENKKTVKDLGFENHGLVVRSSDGKVLWKEPDHEVKIEDVRRELDRLLKK
ncbi:MAG TPA: hypothetical protein VE007_06960 [Thermoanaerobaculia bacterium]|nr:hypothetical protein [Thermoanaerobaculia bacterium]